MNYFEVMEAFHKRVAGIYKAANERKLSRDYVYKAIDVALADTMAELAKRRALSEDKKFCTVKALIF